MNLPSLPKFNRDELLSGVGLQTEPSLGSRVAVTLTTFGVGILVGAGLALLLAPKSGPSLREDLRERLRTAPEDLKEALSAAKAKVGKTTLASSGAP